MRYTSIIIVILITYCLNSYSQEGVDPLEYKNRKKSERLYNEGIQSVLEEDYYSALFYLDSSIALVPEFPKAYNERGKIYFKKERYNDAIMEFEKAGDLDPNFGEAFFNLSFTMFIRDLYLYSKLLLRQYFLLFQIADDQKPHR